MERIFFNNITATSENGCFVGGDEWGKVRYIYFNNVNIRLKKQTEYNGRVADLRPCRDEPFIKNHGVAVWYSRIWDSKLEVNEIR